MYSQDPKIRRRKMKLRFFTYGVMTFATLVLATIGIFYVLGYRVGDSFDLERGALVKFNSRPLNAAVTVDGAVVDLTPDQMNMTVGNHTVSYSLEGYRGWQKTITLKPGEVRWLNYARLLPTSMTTTPIKELQTLPQAKASPDRQYYVLHQNPKTPVFDLVDLTNEENIKITTVKIPANVVTPSAKVGVGSFEIVAWSQDSDYFLVRHKLSDAAEEFIRVPRNEPEDSLNLTELFSTKLRSVQFAANTASIIFATDKANTLYRFDLNNPDKPLVVAKNVSAFDNRNESRVAYVNPATVTSEAKELGQKTPEGRSLKIWQRDDENITELRPVPQKVPVAVKYHKYFNREYVALIAENSVNVVESPLGGRFKTVLADTLTFIPDHISASPGERFFLMQHGSEVYVYDIELDKSYRFTVPNQTTPLQWLDDHHLAFTGGNNLRLMEFDGTNVQFVTSVEKATEVIIGADNKVLLSIGSSGGAPVVQRSFLLNEDER